MKIKPKKSEAEHCTDSAYDSVAYDQVKTALWSGHKRKDKPIDNIRFQAFWLAGSSASASNSDNLVFTGS